MQFFTENSIPHESNTAGAFTLNTIITRSLSLYLYNANFMLQHKWSFMLNICKRRNKATENTATWFTYLHISKAIELNSLLYIHKF